MIEDIFCADCGRKLYPVKVGQEVIELTEKGEPYKVMRGDVLECGACGLQVVTRWGRIVRQHEDDFERKVEAARRIGCLEVA